MLEHVGVIPSVKTMAVTKHEQVSSVGVTATSDQLGLDPRLNASGYETREARRVPAGRDCSVPADFNGSGNDTLVFNPTKKKDQSV